MDALEFKFDHTKKSLLEACGINKEQVEQLYKKVNEVGMSCNSMSEAIEKMSKKFTPLELAFVMNHQNQNAKPQDSSLEILASLMKESDGDGEA